MADNKTTKFEEEKIPETAKAEPTEAPKKEAAKTKAEPKGEERVPLFIPFVEGEDPEWTCGINGKMYKVRKGEQVMVPKAVRKIYDNSNAQEAIAARNRKRLEYVEL